MEPRLPRGPHEPPEPAYKVICVSIYNEDLVELDRLVDTLKDRGIKRVSRSSLLRYAIKKLDLEQVPQSL